MDYKELIEQLRRYEKMLPLDGKAATAIETLLAEREAAIQSVPKNCDTCRYWYDGGCVAPLELFGGCDFGVRQAWQWRGPTPPDRQQSGRQKDKPKEIYNDGKYRAVAVAEWR